MIVRGGVLLLQIPLTMEEIIDSSVEHFTELVNRHHLNDAQQQLVRDIRRRGKNKMAAQNCRKRKMEVIQTIDDEVRIQLTSNQQQKRFTIVCYSKFFSSIQKG